MYPSLVSSLHRDRFSIFSHSLGDHSVHKLPYKLTAAAFGGFPSVEISLIDLEDYASKKGCELLEAAQEIGDVCRLLGLRVTCIQPLRDVIESRKPASDGVTKALRLFPVMDALDTELLLVCSSSLPADQLDQSPETAISHLKAIGLAAANWGPKPKKVAFEALSWGTHINLWRQAWDIVQAVNLENVGICLDSFNTLAREWADPTVEGGIQADADSNLKESMSQLSQLPGSKIFLLQIGDGARLGAPIERGTFERPALMRWSRSSRLFPMESELGGYLPVTEFIEAVVKTGYSGHWSLEIFNNSLKCEADSTPITHAIRGFHGLSKLVKFVFTNNHHLVDQPADPLLAQSPLQLLNRIRPFPFKPTFHRPNLSFSASDSSSIELNHPCSPPQSDPDHFEQAISTSPGKLYGSENDPSFHPHLHISASNRPLHLI
ncbi:hypothetical protein PGT21_010345 [Puccinia graminis f. sp. tritici]|uniref:Xylose isomerase-like TIM barrel domain-containing protein n=1 Tax=Puccinia graminis f. sp. tritici TaxID=56615 RepID=A0A5B0LT37_PUCGR|nr:hypothetical protein PGT21_010345 [Puccinia graminis f. sp. tritici]KAA1092174.1 hypothetical protein PGTUg99_014021 [Puccinia graminis f. sp. tritici]